jgi:hypothetical protein
MYFTRFNFVQRSLRVLAKQSGCAASSKAQPEAIRYFRHPMGMTGSVENIAFSFALHPVKDEAVSKVETPCRGCLKR